MGNPPAVPDGQRPNPADAQSPVPDLPPPAVFPPPRVPDYELLRAIGGGSYGEVWLARNVLGEYRAVKVVYRRTFEQDRPFEREFEGIKRFEPISRSHPSQVAILHVGRNDEARYFYYVMELADEAHATGAADVSPPGSPLPIPKSPGTQLPAPAIKADTYTPRTLRHDLEHRGWLPSHEVQGIALALADALSHLHQHGLVHRDVKPSNIIFVDGVPKLADIGLVAEVGDTRSIVGTEGYLAPEGPGTPAADLYSLGMVLYETATGMDRRKFPELPPDLRERPDAKAVLELNEVLLRACAKDPAQRYASAAAMRADLVRLQRGQSLQHRRTVERAFQLAKKVVPVAALGALMALALSLIRKEGNAPKAGLPPEKASIFVLPFRPTEGSDDEFLRHRLTDAIIDSLGSIEGVRVGPRKSGWVYRPEPEARRDAGRAPFNLRHALTGKVAIPPGQVSIEVSLFQTADDRKLWTETFAGSTNTLIELEKRVIDRVALRLGLSISDGERQQIQRKLTNNLEALYWVRQGWSNFWVITKPAYTLAIEAFNRAIELDPLYAGAEHGRAAVVRMYALDRPHKEVWPEIRKGLRRLMEIDDTYYRALPMLVTARIVYDWNWEDVDAQIAWAVQFNPLADFQWARHYRLCGRLELARVHQDKLEQTEWTTLDIRYHMAAARWVERRYEEGIQVALRTLELHPNHPEGYLWLAHCSIEAGEYAQAIDALQKALAVERQQEWVALLGYAYARQGDREKAREILRELEDLSRGHYVQPYFVARVYAALDQNLDALKWLERAVEDRSEHLVQADNGGLRTDPAWDRLQDEPRFKEILKIVGLDVWPR